MTARRASLGTVGDPAGSDPGAWRMNGHLELGDKPEMITGPYAVLA